MVHLLIYGRVGINTVKKFLYAITSEAGFANHCLRATAMSRMHNSGMPEKIIADKSGHRSMDALRAYEKICIEQLKNQLLILPLNLTSVILLFLSVTQ